MSESAYMFLSILTVGLVTAFTRWVPFLLFGGKKEIPPRVRRLGELLPRAIMVILLLYCLRGTDFSAPARGLPEILSVGLVMALQLWKKNALLSIFAGTAAYMLLIRLI